ncbi:MAG: O-methyltransferase [Lachnospiraceae bacterium]|nr:O-methyltransferase [Lachnospiraceae bacterium]
MTKERQTAFIRSLDQGNIPFLDHIEQEAREAGVPIIRPETQKLLRFLLQMQKPHRILEIGCAVGFSALLMSEYGETDCHITTIENYEKRIVQARENFKRAGKEKKITLLAGDAADILPKLTDSYDMIFMDAAKGQYLSFLPEVKRLLSPDGLLVSDNVLQEGDILESRYAVTRRDRTIHGRMREYLYQITHDPKFETVILSVGDGVAASKVRRVPDMEV